MTIIKTYVHQRRHIRQLNRTIKRCRNEAKVYRDEAEYYQAVIDNIWSKFHLESVSQLIE